MGMLDFLKREKRAEGVRASDPFLAQYLGLFNSNGLPSVSPEQAISNIAVAAACVRVRSETMASVPLHIYDREGGRSRADTHPLYEALHDQPNGFQTAFEAREFLLRSLDLTGNAYAQIIHNGAGYAVGFIPLMSSQVAVEMLPTGRLRYRVSGRDGGTWTFLQEEILHIRGASRDGIIGQSALQIGRDAVALRVAQSQTAASLMANGLRPSGAISYPERLAPGSQEQIRDGIAKKFQGTDNAGQVLILDGGAKYDALSWTPEDAELLATMKASNEDIARLFGVPPTVIGITDRGTYSNTEQEGKALVANCLGPLAKRVEAAMMRCLLTSEERRRFYIEFDLSGLMRGDLQGRFEAYRIGREIGVYSPNDILAMENSPPIPGGDTYSQPANWVPLGTVPATPGGA
jgi:HK97 family phage portal protein